MFSYRSLLVPVFIAKLMLSVSCLVVADSSINITARTLSNKVAYIPPQCYTKTEDQSGDVHNPCFVCHTIGQRPNYINDADLQLNYSFNDTARKNHWENLFQDRSQAVAAISDEQILQYINASNYFDGQGRIILAEKLAQLPENWDYDRNGVWNGYTPDIWFNFDDQGFDRDKQGGYSGWRAYGYYPYPGTFWPTNGSTGDVMIRLPIAFRRNQRGESDLTVYKVNLAIVEAMLKEQDIPIDPVNENRLGGIDLDKNGELGMARLVRYDWAPLQQRFMWYVGQAYDLQKQGKLHLAAGLFPEGTEFLHTVRYVAVDEQGHNQLSPRLKELRYARKRFWMNYSKLEDKIHAEMKEKHDFPDRVRVFRGNSEVGVSNGQGWSYTAFIEDKNGQLRPQSFEELVFCAGCHSGVGSVRDGIFSFSRKFSAASPQKGWHHWSQYGLKGVTEPIRNDGKYEYTYYLEKNKSANEFRTNAEAQGKFFDQQGNLKADAVSQLHKDISWLLFASKQRALELNKAYLTIVREQSFAKGRDAVVKPLENVHRSLKPDQETGIQLPLSYLPLLDSEIVGMLNEDQDLYLPALLYREQYYWAEFEKTSTDNLLWELASHGLYGGELPAGSTSVLDNNLYLTLPLISNGAMLFSAEMEYSHQQNDQYLWRLSDFSHYSETGSE